MIRELWEILIIGLRAKDLLALVSIGAFIVALAAYFGGAQ